MWKAAEEILAHAQAEGLVLPILLGDARDCSRILYWGHAERIALRNGRTEYVVDRLRDLDGRHSPQELLLRSRNRRISPGFIRPYAICHTPSFLGAEAEPCLLPDERLTERTLSEGATISVTVNAYERSREARRLCIAHYGCKCSACGIDFGAAYGEIGTGFIHVHHLVPLSEIRSKYVVDPVRDMRPVCPNCHAMIHLARPPRRIEDIARMRQRSQSVAHRFERTPRDA